MVQNLQLRYWTCLLALLLLGSYKLHPEQVTAVNKPNIIWIIAEDLSPDFRFNGNMAVQTPFMDSLFSIGKYYSGVFSTGVACSPSRTAFATGYYQNTIGAHHMRYPEDLKPTLPDSIKPVHKRLKEAGYQTANIKNYPGNGKTDWQFDYPENSYDQFKWQDINPDQPYFARINLRLTHRPFEADTINPVDPMSVALPPYVPDHEVSRNDWRNYFESIQILDGQISGIVKEIRKYGLDKNTLIFFFSDHGRPMTRAKNYLYDSGLNVPLIIFSLDSRLKQKYSLYGQESGLFSMIDISQTTLELGNVPDAKTQGISIINISGRSNVWAASDRIGEVFFKSRMIRNSHLKYIRNYNFGFSINEASTAYTKANYPTYHLYNALNEKGRLMPDQQQITEQVKPEELYDLIKDPYELNNLVNDPNYEVSLNNMRMELDQISDEIKDLGLQNDSQQLEHAFEKYGIDSYRENKSKILQLRNEVFGIIK